MEKLLNIVFWGLVMISGIHGLSSFNPDQLTREQSAAVSKLRELVDIEEIKESFMTEDYYLAKVLNQAEFDVEKAQELFKKYLQNRKDLDLSSILQENFGQLRVLFPITRGTLDINGRPVVYRDLGQWQVNRFLEVAGSAGRAKLGRYMLLIVEEAADHVRRLRAQGSNVTSFDYILNAADFSLEQNVPADFNGVSFPEGLDTILYIEKVVIVNAPKSMQGPLSLLDEKFRAMITIYGQDQQLWQEYLSEFIGNQQFPEGIFRSINKKDNNDGLFRW